MVYKEVPTPQRQARSSSVLLRRRAALLQPPAFQLILFHSSQPMAIESTG
jgi:hypothetical protein